MFQFFDYVSTMVNTLWSVVKMGLQAAKAVIDITIHIFGFIVDVVAYIPDFAEPYIFAVIAISVICVFVGKFVDLA